MNRLFFKKLLFYGAIGSIALGCDLAIFSVLVSISISPPIANVFGFSTGMVVSYCGNFKFTFKAQGQKIGRRLLKFIAVNLFGLVLSSVVLYILMFSMPAMYAKLITLPLVAVTQFLMNSFWTFS